MKYIVIFFLALFSCLLSGAEAAHRILVSGCGLGKIAIVGENQKIEWSIPFQDEVSDAILLPNGNILHSVKQQGIREIRPDYASGEGAEIVWQWTPPFWEGKRGETHSCQLLPGGVILTGESFDKLSFIREIDRKTGKVLKVIELRDLGSAHGTFRQIRKTPQGTYLVTQQKNGGKAMEYDAAGKLLRTFQEGRYVAIRLPNGNTLIACGDAHKLIEVSPENALVWEVNQNDIPHVKLGFVAGVQRLPNGNTVFCNWGGHGGTSGPAVMEITPDKKVVWSLSPTIPNNVSSIQIIDAGILKQESLR